jgi:hypothetical protein
MARSLRARETAHSGFRFLGRCTRYGVLAYNVTHDTSYGRGAVEHRADPLRLKSEARTVAYCNVISIRYGIFLK